MLASVPDQRFCDPFARNHVPRFVRPKRGGDERKRVSLKSPVRENRTLESVGGYWATGSPTAMAPEHHNLSWRHIVVLDAEKFLNPDAIKINLVLSSLYLAAYEILKSAIIDNIRDFLIFDYDVNGKPVLDKQYRDDVSNLHQDLLQASCLWLGQAGVITSDEVEEIGRIRKHRNEVAHELPQLLVERDRNLNLDYFLRIRELLEKIEIWWVRNVEILINPELDGLDIDDKDIRPGRVIALDHLISVALSDYLEEGGASGCT